MNETITLTIDGKEVAVAKGATVLEAARSAGIVIPTLCYHPKLRPIGSCRLCLVEIAGTEKPVTSCTTPAGDKMVVTTQSPRLFELRREAISYLLINHPLDCPVCDKAGECRLQDLAFQYTVNREPYKFPPVALPVDTLSPLVERNNNRCVRCGRCVSICNEIQGEAALEWSKGGYDAEILPKGGYPLQCEFCGQCIAICPVGALTSRLFKYKARAWEMDRVASVCPYCGGGCALELNVRNNKLLRVTSDDKATHNEGNLCIRGTFGYGFVHNHNRLHTPLIKRRNEQVPVSWDDALNSAAFSLKKIVEESGPQSVAGLGSARVSNEDNYLFQKLLRTGVGTNNIDSGAHFSYRNLERGLTPTIGFPAGTLALKEIDDARAILVIGADVQAEMTPASLHIMKAARFSGAKLLVANPRATKLDRYANLRLRYYPGAELALAAGIARAILDNGWEAKEFVANVSQLAEYKQSLEALTVEKAAAMTGVPAELFTTVAELLTTSETGCIVFGYNVFTHQQGKEVVAALADLALLTGKLGRKSCGLVPVIAKNNAQGMLDMGVMPDLLPGYQPLASGEAFEKVWGRPIPQVPGNNTEEILQGIENGSIRALYLMGCNPLHEFPEPRRWEEALKKLSWLVVQDVFPTEAANLAHYVFPASTFAEKAGSFTSGERRVQKFAPAVDPYRNALPDWKIIQQFAQSLGYPMEYAHPAAILKEIASVVPYYSKIGPDSLTRMGMLWGPAGLEETAFLPTEKLTLSFAPVTIQDGEPATAAYRLVTGSAFFHSGTLSTYAPGPNILGKAAWVEVNVEDAKHLGVKSGDTVTVGANGQSLKASVRITAAVPGGVIYIPYHYREAQVNNLLGYRNYCLVEVKKG